MPPIIFDAATFAAAVATPLNHMITSSTDTPRSALPPLCARPHGGGVRGAAHDARAVRCEAQRYYDNAGGMLSALRAQRHGALCVQRKRCYVYALFTDVGCFSFAFDVFR